MERCGESFVTKCLKDLKPPLPISGDSNSLLGLVETMLREVVAFNKHVAGAFGELLPTAKRCYTKPMREAVTKQLQPHLPTLSIEETPELFALVAKTFNVLDLLSECPTKESTVYALLPLLENWLRDK